MEGTLVQPADAARGIQRSAAARTARSRLLAGAGALALLALACAAGCRTTQQVERPLSLQVTAATAGAPITVSATADSAPFTPVAGTPLGRSPVVIEPLVIVRWRSISGTYHYWLRDDGGRLPRNAARPQEYDAAFAAGDDYPLDLHFVGGAGGEAGSAFVRIDRAKLERLFDEQVLNVKLLPGTARDTPARTNMPARR